MTPLACNLTAIHAADRPLYGVLVKRLRAAIESEDELSDGYSFALNTRVITLPEVAEWIGMESLCCPFLRFQIDVEGATSMLTLRGPAGVKAILREEFLAKR